MIELIRQKYTHNPPYSFGDCQRTAMAMILGLPQDSIPNFGVYYEDTAAWIKAETEFLQALGLYSVNVPIDGDLPFGRAIEVFRSFSGNRPFLMSGHSAGGTDHTICIDEDGTILDPAGREEAFIGPCSSGYWYMQVFAKLPHKWETISWVPLPSQEAEEYKQRIKTLEHELARVQGELDARKETPHMQFEDPRVKAVYDILCEDATPPVGEH